MASTGGRHAFESTSAQFTASPVGYVASHMQGGTFGRKPKQGSRSSSKSSRTSSARSQPSQSSSDRSSTEITEATSTTTNESTKKLDTDSKKSNFATKFPTPVHLNSVETSSDIGKDAWVREQILLKLKKHVTHLLETFCIVDLQAYGAPTLATSRDLLPTEGFVECKPHFIHSEYLGQSSQITAERYGDGRQKYCVIVAGDLHDPTYDFSIAGQRFYGHLDLTDLVNAVRASQGDVRTSEDPPPDLFLAIAIEEMDALGFRIRRRPKPGMSKRVSRKSQLDLAMDLIRYIHKDYFVLESSDVEKVYHIAQVSPSLLEPNNSASQPPDLSPLINHLARREKFHCDVAWAGSKVAYCLPMKGQYRDCWLCFLVDGTLPAIR